jgi:hypothetical protein
MPEQELGYPCHWQTALCFALPTPLIATMAMGKLKRDDVIKI